jgi:hypothetical protein
MGNFGPNGIERRRHPRVHFFAEALISEAGRTLGPVSIHDLSASGASLVGHLEAVVGSTVQVTITSGKLAGASFQAEVRWTAVRPNFVRIGVQILQAQNTAAKLIQDVVLEELQRASQEPDERPTEPLKRASGRADGGRGGGIP